MKLAIHGLVGVVVSIALADRVRAVQEIFVDFDSILMEVDAGAVPGMMGIPPADELYDYSAGQREEILFYLNDRYDRHGVMFLPGLPDVPGSTSVVTLNKGSGGFSDGVDFRNLDDSDGAEVNTIALFKFLGKDAATDPWTDLDVAVATANAVAHEAGHILGVRHQDSFGPIGTGIGTFPGDYAPTYPFPAGAPATAESISFLTTGLGLSFSGITSASFVSEQAAVKLEIAKADFAGAVVVDEISGNQMLAAAQLVELADFTMSYPFRDMPDLLSIPVEELPIDIPTTIDGRARVVTGSMDVTDTMGKHLSDYYKFEAELGTFVTIEVMSKILEGGDRYGDPVDVAVILLDGITGAPLKYGPGTSVDAANDDDFATSDKGASLIDVKLPAVFNTSPISGFGTYALEVVSANSDDHFFVSPGPGKDGTDGGDYELLIYQAKTIEEPFPPGFADFNGDGDVDGTDLLAWQRGNGTPFPDALKADGDADEDTDVDGEDLFQWTIQYGITGLPIDGVGSSRSVPEPATGILLLLTLPLLLKRQGRKER